MVLGELFKVLLVSIRPGTRESLASGIREMSALRSIVFRPPPTVELPPPPPPPVAVPVPTLVRVYRPRKSTSSGPADRYAPYRLLWVKVIIRAAYDYALWKDSKDLRHRKFAEDARKWIFDKSDLENSLAHLCELWGLPLEKIRKFARELTKDDVKKLEFKERQGRELAPAPTP